MYGKIITLISLLIIMQMEVVEFTIKGQEYGQLQSGPTETPQDQNGTNMRETI